MSDLFGNHIVGFPTRRLILQVLFLYDYLLQAVVESYCGIQRRQEPVQTHSQEVAFILYSDLYFDDTFLVYYEQKGTVKFILNSKHSFKKLENRA